MSIEQDIERASWMLIKATADHYGDRVPETFDTALSEKLTRACLIAFYAEREPDEGEVRAVARALDPVAWEYFDADPTRHFDVEPSLGKARAAISASDKWRAKRLGEKG